MKPTLQQQLEYLTRTVNPDYIIIVKNKADEHMNFDNFRPVTPEEKEKYKPQKRYSIQYQDYDDTGKLKLVLVKDAYSNNRVIYECICKTVHLEENLETVKRLYKGSDILDKI